MTRKQAWVMLAEAVAAHRETQAHYLCWYTDSEYYFDSHEDTAFVETVPLEVREQMTKTIQLHTNGEGILDSDTRSAAGRDARVLFCLLMAEVGA